MWTVWAYSRVLTGFLCLFHSCALTTSQDQKTAERHPLCPSDEYPILWGNLESGAISSDFPQDQLFLEARSPIQEDSSQISTTLSVCVTGEQTLKIPPVMTWNALRMSGHRHFKPGIFDRFLYIFVK